MCFSQPKAPSLPPATAAPAPVDTTDASGADAQAAAKKRQQQAKLAKGAASTILTSGMGLTNPATTKKTILGAGLSGAAQ